MRVHFLIVAGLMPLSAAASASETATYTYDAKGRLTKVEHAGGRTNGMISTYSFDAVDNRLSYQVTGARGRIIVVPLGGLRPIPSG